MADPYLITKHLLAENSDCNVADSKIMDLIEFGRIIHAEMSAICDTSRNGLSLKAATMHCTIFPCHICAKHIIASGVSRVVYLEPYPKSYAFELHDDSIVVDAGEQTEKFASIHSSGLLRIGIEIFLRKDGESMPVGLPRNGTRVSADL